MILDFPKDPQEKWCPSCEEMQPLDNFYFSTGKRPRRAPYCIPCDNQRVREARMARRKAVLDSMGGCCIECGFADWRALQIDHVNGGGTAEHKVMGTTAAFYAKVVTNPEDYQLLCANCNWIKKYENDENKKAA